MYYLDERVREAFTEGDCFAFAIYLAEKYPHLSLYQLDGYAHVIVKHEGTGHYYDVTGKINWARTAAFFCLDTEEARTPRHVSLEEVRGVARDRQFPEVSLQEGEEHLAKNLSRRELAAFQVG